MYKNSGLYYYLYKSYMFIFLKEVVLERVFVNLVLEILGFFMLEVKEKFEFLDELKLEIVFVKDILFKFLEGLVIVLLEGCRVILEIDIFVKLFLFVSKL